VTKAPIAPASTASKTDIYTQIAQLHMSNLDKSFLASLGPVFLSEVYRAMDQGDETALFYHIIDGEIVGFITGGHSMAPVYKAMFPRIWRWGLPLGLTLLSPRKLRRVIDILRYGKSEDGVFSNLSIPQAELFSIALSPAARGHGIAPTLYQNLVDYFKARNINSFRIIVGNSLDAAHKFYTKMGAKVVTEIELHPGEISKVYVHDSPDKTI